tara:strand:+ start:542 stop:841 length:300 start_codon:yes stop_codon:yes gene_type:complete
MTAPANMQQAVDEAARKAREEFAYLDGISRKRALTDAESIDLERCIAVLDGRELCSSCHTPFPRRRRNPKTSLCRHCWSVKALPPLVSAVAADARKQAQ